MSTALTANESTLLASFEGTIERGLASFTEVGSALMAIRDGKLYRQSHKTFEAYCKERWGFSRVHAHRVIEAAETVEMLPIGNKPRTESQARELAKAPKEQQAAVWAAAVESAPRNSKGEPQVTAKHVERAVKALTESKSPKEEKPAGPALPATEAFDEIAALLKSLVSNATDLHKTDAGKFLNIKLLRSLANDIRKLVKEAMPVAICPYCEGRGCGICARTGAVTREIHSQFVPEGK